MRPLTDRERRTLRLGGLALLAYLLLFFGVQTWKHSERRRSQYDALRREAAVWNDRLDVHQARVTATRDLMEKLRLDPASLSRTTLVAQASANLQQAARQGGVQLSSIRETPARTAGPDLSAIQLEAMGPAVGVLRFLQSLDSLGVPLITDSLQLAPLQPGAGQLKLNLNLVIPDFDNWKPTDRRPDA
jgi:hypothetical protein